jgi:hypothetical protein
MGKLLASQQPIPLRMVGSTVFGRYPKISSEQTYNMIISDDWLVPYAGHRRVANRDLNGQGRDIYTSSKLGLMITVINSSVSTFDGISDPKFIGNLETSTGDVTIAENNAGQIMICDRQSLYLYDYINSTFNKIPLNFTPIYVSFQNTYFIAAAQYPSGGNFQWRLSDPSDGTSFPDDANHDGEFETAADNVLAVVPLPGKGNLLMVCGSIVSEFWYDTGLQLFPYSKNTFSNLNYGVISPATIATGSISPEGQNPQDIVIWLAGNSNSGATIMYSAGGAPIQISTDGINYKLAQLKHPEDSYGFFFKQDGHPFYQITFVSDNLSYAYDFETNKFFTLSDPDLNYHIAKKVAYFKGKYYFVSINDGGIYEFGSNITNSDGVETPRIRITNTIRLPDNSLFIVDNLNFVLEQGISSTAQRIDLSISRDGGEAFGSASQIPMNTLANRRNKVDVYALGSANEFTPQFRFWGLDRFVVGNGSVSIHQ